MVTQKLKHYYQFIQLISNLEGKGHTITERVVTSDWKGKDIYIVKYL